jgi:hypothetical protein
MAENNINFSSSSAPGIEPADAQIIHVIEHGRNIHMFRLTEVELDSLKSNFDSLSLGFCSMCLGAFIGFIVPLVTVPLSDKMFAIFISLSVLLFVLTIFFGIKWYSDRKSAIKRIRQIQNRGL